MSQKSIALIIVLLTSAVLSATSATDLIVSLSKATNHYEWARLSREVEKQGLSISKTNAAAFVRHGLVQLSTTDLKTDGARVNAEIVAMGAQALPTLIEGITNAARPAPIFGDSAVANIPINSMRLLAQMKSQEAVPALVDFIDKFETDIIIHGPDGKPQNHVVSVLKTITGQDFGTDKSKWMKWYVGSRKKKQ